MSQSASGRSFDEFLTAIRTFESGIDPEKAGFYADNYISGQTIQYPKVDSPGRVVRDDAGNPVMEETNYKDFFQKIGVDSLYTKGSTDPEMFRKMQYNVINYLGFIGYQLGEGALMDIGYYQAKTDDQGLNEYYVWVDNSTWANGVRDKVINPWGTEIHATDVNRWQGTFSGKSGILSFDDLKDPPKQDQAMQDNLKHNYDMINSQLTGGKTIADLVGTTVSWDGCDPSIAPPPGGRANEVILSVSGILAGAHLRGAGGAAQLLNTHQNTPDENNTYILQYIQDFGGYETPWE